MIFSTLTAASPRAKSILSGRVSVVIKNGKIDQTELTRLRINAMELMEELRQKDVFDPTTVGCAYLEPNGELSVQLVPGERPVTASQLSIDTSGEAVLYTTVIAHGRVMSSNLCSCGKNDKWLAGELKKHGYSSASDIYLMITDNNGGSIIIPREEFRRSRGKENA